MCESIDISAVHIVDITSNYTADRRDLFCSEAFLCTFLGVIKESTWLRCLPQCFDARPTQQFEIGKLILGVTVTVKFCLPSTRLMINSAKKNYKSWVVFTKYQSVFLLNFSCAIPSLQSSTFNSNKSNVKAPNEQDSIKSTQIKVKQLDL